MKLPTFSRQTQDEGSTAANPGTTPVRERRDASVAAPDDATTTHFTTDDATTTHFTTAGAAADQAGKADKPKADKPTKADRAEAEADRAAVTAQQQRANKPGLTGPKPRASLLATLGLVLAVASALLVLSGPLLGYGIGLAVLALILSLSGIHATGKRHVAGKSDALLGMGLSLAAIVVGVLALTGSLSWLGTDTQTVNTTREWLDAQIANRF